ncbi:MAG TPA: MSHA biogenesis protein MshE, partial [Myxococcota bacterium]|nr:MSHA biogenesis protein MshE [Myxococcota bacterium]
MARKKIRIGELLVENQVISETQLRSALAEQKKSGLKLGRQLIEAGYVEEERFLSFLSQQLDIPLVDLARYEIRSATVELLPETYARRFRAIVLEVKNGTATVGLADPTNIFAIDELERILKMSVEPAVVRESQLLAAIDRNYLDPARANPRRM